MDELQRWNRLFTTNLDNRKRLKEAQAITRYEAGSHWHYLNKLPKLLADKLWQDRTGTPTARTLEELWRKCNENVQHVPRMQQERDVNEEHIGPTCLAALMAFEARSAFHVTVTGTVRTFLLGSAWHSAWHSAWPGACCPSRPAPQPKCPGAESRSLGPAGSAARFYSLLQSCTGDWRMSLSRSAPSTIALKVFCEAKQLSQ